MKTAITLVFFLVNSLLFAQWSQTVTPEGGGITDMVVLDDGTLIASVSSFNWPGGQQGGIRRSTNEGASWQNVINAYNGRTLHKGTSGKIFASYWLYPQNEGVYYSTNNGLNWTQSYFGNSNDNVFSITSKDNDNTVFIGTRYGVWRSINNGLWQFVSNGIPANTFVYDLDIDLTGNYIAAGTSKGLYLSSNNGANWSAVSGVAITDTIFTVKFAHFSADNPENNLFAGSTLGKLFRSNGDYGAAVIVYMFFGRMGDLEIVDNKTFSFLAAAMIDFSFDNSVGAGYTYSTDRGINWTQHNSGLPSSPKMSALTFQIQGNNVRYYAGLFENSIGGAKIYKLDSPIGIEQISSEIANQFSLEQNYPNPFNPMTKIKFNVSRTSNINITVFDVLGQHITTLVNERLSAGSYETQWNAADMPGGVYFYRLETDDFTETKKMILVK